MRHSQHVSTMLTREPRFLLLFTANTVERSISYYNYGKSAAGFLANMYSLFANKS